MKCALSFLFSRFFSAAAFLFALSFSVFLPTYVWAGCPSFVDPVVTVQPLWPVPRYDNSVSLAGLHVMAGQPHVATAGQREVPIGLTASNLKIDASYKLVTQPFSDDGGVCSHVSAFDLRFGFDDTTVFVAREIAPYSCGHHEVVAHEIGHVDIDRALVGAYVPYMQEWLTQELRRIGAVRAASAAETEAHLRAAINAYLRDLGANISAERERRQAAYDSPEEYRRLSMACNGELSSLIGAVPASYGPY